MRMLSVMLLSILPLAVHADVVVPAEKVENSVNIRLEPDAASDVVGKLKKGESLPHVSSDSGWHEVQLEGDATGYISADWSMVQAGEPGVAEEITEAAVEEETEAVVEAAVEEDVEEVVEEPVEKEVTEAIDEAEEEAVVEVTIDVDEETVAETVEPEPEEAPTEVAAETEVEVTTQAVAETVVVTGPPGPAGGTGRLRGPRAAAKQSYVAG